MDITAKGRNGQVSFDGQTVTITREGFIGRTTHGRSEKRIPATGIGAIQVKPFSALSWGYIQFSVLGEVSKQALLGKQSRDAAKDENAVTFTKAQEQGFLDLRDAIEAAKAAPSPAAAPDAAEQLAKLASLRDSGVITEDEFTAKKTEILSRI